MTDQDWERVKELFHEALTRPEEERAAWIDERCGDDTHLRGKVDGLLQAHDEAGGFLGAPARIAGAESPGTMIGRYKLIEHIGEGGFGDVWRAEQQEPIRREVALKIVKLGMDTKQVIARFEAERQALAMMDHPNIATVLDAGATDTGRPYFVMELVRGVPITEFSDSNALSTAERLDLFLPVCRAVQHAHQKGVIHRDLKPSNVLVTLHDGTPVPKVIDFGIAKATGRKLTEKTLFTAFRQCVGTPAYMSPEQAEMSGLDVDVRSDVYSLGVLLYELLTGTTPLETRALEERAWEEIQRVLREVDPPPPSLRVSTLGDRSAEIAARRGDDPAPLARQLRGELDWIVMKSLEKDRTRRYDSVSDLAEDVRRHLAQEPVTAGPPGRVYLMRKFVARHRLSVAVAGLLLLAMIGALWASTMLTVRAREARRAAALQAARAQQIAGFMNEMMVSVEPPGAAEADPVSVREVLDAGAARLESLEERPEIEARLRSTLAQSYLGLGEHEIARTHLEQVAESYRTLYGETHPETLRARLLLSHALAAGGAVDEAVALATPAHAALVVTLGDDHEDVRAAVERITKWLDDAGRPEEAAAWRTRLESGD